MKQLLLFFSFTVLIAPFRAKAQTRFLNKVSIEYKKTIAIRPLYSELYPVDVYEKIKETLPFLDSSYFEFTGDSMKSLYEPSPKNSLNETKFRGIADKNIVFNDYQKEMTVAQKTVFDQQFLLKDSFSTIKWKLTGDYRTIAGYKCHKAIGILQDSIGVFAFYTDEILIPGGPESIQGLPGMILGLGIPKIHTTWFATKVSVSNISEVKVVPPTQGKPTNRENLIRLLQAALKNMQFGNKLLIECII